MTFTSTMLSPARFRQNTHNIETYQQRISTNQVYYSSNTNNFNFENNSSQLFFAKRDLIDLYNKERAYKSIINDLKVQIANLSNRIKKSRRILRQPINDDLNSNAIDVLLADIEKAEKLMKKNPLEAIEASNQQELQKCIELENINSQMKVSLSLLQQSTIQLLSPRRNMSFISALEPVFGSQTIDNSLAEADQKILFLQDSISRRKRQLKARKSEIKKLEKKYKDSRQISEDLYATKQKTIADLSNELEINKSLQEKTLLLADTIIHMKKDLVDLQAKRQQLERENYTVSRDRIYNERFKKQIDELHKRLSDKQTEIAESDRVIRNMMSNISQLKAQVSAFEVSLIDDESRIKKLEAKVDSYGIKVDKKIDKSKRELSAFTEMSEVRTGLEHGHSMIFDELAQLFNGKSPRPVKSPRESFATPRRSPRNNSPTKTVINMDAGPYISPIAAKSPKGSMIASPIRYQQTEITTPSRSVMKSPKYSSPMYIDQLSKVFN